MEQTVALLADENNITNSLVKPLVMNGVTLLSPGVWTGMDNKPTRYTSESIAKGFEKTDWDDMNLFLDHKDTKDGSAVSSWVGFVRNPRMNAGKLVGDLEIWHPLISMFLEKAKAKFAVSATMNGSEQLSLQGDSYDYVINSFKSMSVVDTPGCDEAWLPRLLSKGITGDKKVTGGSLEEVKIKTLEKNEVAEQPKEEDTHISEKNLNRCKEVKKMEKDEIKEEAASEEAEDESEEEESDVKEESKAEVKDEKAMESASVDDVKALQTELAEIKELLKSLKQPKALEEPKVKEEKVLEKTEDVDMAKELSSAREEISKMKKELSDMKVEMDNVPDQKTLSAGNVIAETNPIDSNMAMIDFFRKNNPSI